jgi:hypothetical protein
MDETDSFVFTAFEAEASEPELMEVLSSSLGTSTGMLGEWLIFFILVWRKCASFDAAPFESEKRERFGDV